MSSIACKRSEGFLESQYSFSSGASKSDATEKWVLSIFGMEFGLFVKIDTPSF